MHEQEWLTLNLFFSSVVEVSLFALYVCLTPRSGRLFVVANLGYMHRM